MRNETGSGRRPNCVDRAMPKMQAPTGKRASSGGETLEAVTLPATSISKRTTSSGEPVRSADPPKSSGNAGANAFSESSEDLRVALAAVSDAIRSAKARKEERMGAATGGIDLGALGGLLG